MIPRRAFSVPVAALLALLYAASPYAVFGFEGGGCGCKLGPLVCGEDGYVCYCCVDAAKDRREGPSISKCRMGAKYFALAAPPAEPAQSQWTPVQLPFVHLVIRPGVPRTPAFEFLPFKPPEAA